MLKVLNLYVIDQIFNEFEGLSASSKIIYINCLMHHFRNKAANVSSAIAFDLFKEDFGDFEKYKMNFQELHKARLVELGYDKISFNNVWGKYIDWSQLEKVSANVYVGGFQMKTIKDFKKDLISNQSLIDLAQMKYHLSKTQVEKLISLFIKEQETYEKTYMNLSDAIRHCTFWIGTNSVKVPAETIKSKGKILGR
jgi:hypothetical protein